MADVSARLAQGLPAVDNAGAYAEACQRLGYTGVSDASLREWYGTEDGMDLVALQEDSDAIGMAASAVEAAAQRESAVVARLAGVWSGGAGSAAQGFLARQNDAAAAVRDGLVTAAAALTTLRDDLWQAVDAKVNAALDIDSRPSGQRGQWLAAAHTVTTGAGDVATASELVDQQVKPFVDNDIGAEWLSEMRAGFDRVTAAFDAAIARLEACPAARFDAAGQEGPAWDTGPSGQPPASTAPSAAPLEAPVAAPSQGGGMPSPGGGLSGFGQQLADLIGGITGSGDALSGVGGISEPDDLLPEPEDAEPGDEPEEFDEPEELEELDEPDQDEEAPQEEEPVEESPEDTAPEQSAEAAEPMSAPVPVTAPPAPPAALAPEVLAAEGTPCEIAAEELPRVGE